MTSSAEQLLSTDQQTPNDDQQKEKSQSKVTKKSLGRGLTKIVRNGEVVSYEFRMMHKGTPYEKSLGSAKDLSEEQARIEAEKYRTKILRERHKNSIEKLSADLAMPRIPCFKSYEYARNFVKELNQIAPLNPERFTSGNLEPIDLELYGVIWLMLLLPLSMEDLLQLRPPDIYLKAAEPYLTLQRGGKHTSYLVVDLPDSAIKIFEALEMKLDRDSYREGLFPLLRRLSKSELKNEMKQVLNKISPTYVIDTNKFIAYFEFTAVKFSCFRSEFIKDYTKKRRGQNECWISNSARRLLMTWWESHLLQETNFTKLDLSLLSAPQKRRSSPSIGNRR